MRQLLIEGGVLTIAGAALGFALWGAGASMLRSGNLLAVPRGGEVALDGGVAAFTVLIAQDVAARERLRAKLEKALSEDFPNLIGRVSPLSACTRKVHWTRTRPWLRP